MRSSLSNLLKDIFGQANEAVFPFLLLIELQTILGAQLKFLFQTFQHTRMSFIGHISCSSRLFKSIMAVDFDYISLYESNTAMSG